MKNILLCSALLFNICSFAQPVPDYIITVNSSDYLRKVSFTDYGEKFFYYYNPYPYDTLQIVLKNYDGSVFKTFTPFAGVYESSVSDKLFDNDSEIEFLATKIVPPGNLLYIVNESGSIEYTFPDTVWAYISIFKWAGAYKMSYEIAENGQGTGKYRTFSLPGSIPCDECDILNGMEEPGIGISESGMKAYPNPFNQTLSIEYNFSKSQNRKLVLTGVDGKELKSITLNNQSDKLTLSTADLPKGMIIANLYGKNGNLISKKLVKIE